MVSFDILKQGMIRKVPDIEQESEENSGNGKTVHMAERKLYFLQIAGVIGAFAVALGAYGSHVLHPRSDVPDERKRIFDTGNFYHFVHTLALLAVPLTNKPSLVGIFLLLGICLFSGSCYITAITGNTQVAAAAPFGGIAFILGWTCMVL